MPERAHPVAVFAATGAGAGCMRPAPGTWGSVAAILLAWPWLTYAPATWQAPGLLVAAIAATVLGLWAVPHAQHHYGLLDPSQVVIDEYAGQWLTLACLPLAAGIASPWAVLMVSLLTFRLFDIVKPWPISALERLPGAWGVMADDLAAGLAAGALTYAVMAMRILP